MKTRLINFLSSMAGLGIASSAYSLTIVPTFDSSITSDPNGAAMISAINVAIGVLQTNLTDLSTVKILFVSDESVGLGQADTWGREYNYAGYLTALRNRAVSVNDTQALSTLPNSANDPLTGNTKIYLQLPLARLMGLDSGYGPDGYDATVSIKMSVHNFTRPPVDPNKWDLVETVEHEIDEVLGFVSNLRNGYPGGPIGPPDLFRYTTNLVRTWTTAGDDAYFSLDGTNLLARFNQEPDSDYQDWWSKSGVWSPPGTTPHEQLQDAFTFPGATQDLGANEMAMLDVIGYTLPVTTPATSPTLRIVASGVGQITLSWSNDASGFVLQERTNLVTGSWANATSGSANPAVLVPTTAQTFYRLYKPTLLSRVTAQTVAVPPARNAALHRVTHVFRQRQP